MFIVSYIMACLRSSVKIGYIGIQIAYVTFGEGVGKVEKQRPQQQKRATQRLDDAYQVRIKRLK